MKKFNIFLFTFIFCFSILSAQEDSQDNQIDENNDSEIVKNKITAQWGIKAGANASGGLLENILATSKYGAYAGALLEISASKIPKIKTQLELSYVQNGVNSIDKSMGEDINLNQIVGSIATRYLISNVVNLYAGGYLSVNLENEYNYNRDTILFKPIDLGLLTGVEFRLSSHWSIDGRFNFTFF